MYGIINTDHIKSTINGFPWKRSFANLDTNDKVYLFNKTIKNILLHFIAHETITFDHRNPRWINSQLKHLIHEKKMLRTKISQSFTMFQFFKDHLSSLIVTLKNKYYSKVAKNF